MSVKTYLQEQIRLVSLSGYDLFTDEEYDLYMEIIAIGKELDKLYAANAEEEKKRPLLDLKKEKKKALEVLIRTHKDRPRTVRLKSVAYGDEEAEGVNWVNLKISKKIAEFSCELSRAMMLEPNQATMDLIVIKWKNIDELYQIVIYGFYFPILMPNGQVENRKYRLFSASAGQLRRDKILCIAEDAWTAVKDQIEGGLSWEWINERGSLNPNKYMAYLALCNSATDVWEDFDIDRTIVIDEFKSNVTSRMMYIKPDYTYEIGEQTVEIDQTDGCGMMLPEVSTSNFMIRATVIKGLLCSFDYIKFCRVNNIKPELTDAWGLKHDLIKEKIQIVLTTSQFKLWKLFKSWEEYKEKFKANNCHFCKTNYEEDYIPDTYLNYQMLQTLTDFTDEEIKQFTAREHERIKNMARNKDEMLKTLGADRNSESPYKAALSYYPELLRESYSKESLKNIRKRMILDAKSGKIRCQNKRLFAIPDLYACCEFWFLGDKDPKGLLKDGEIACRIFRRHDKADVLRSPHLYMEHCVRKIVHDQEIYDWFYTNGIYMSCHDLMCHVLQCDWDGDQLNVVVEPLIVEIAERNVRKYDVIPLFYDANKADPEPLSWESLYNALKRAHDYSGIGEVSNMLTRLWNKEEPDRVAAAFLTRYNNDVIDAAKTGRIIHYSQFPKVARRIGKATGGKNGRMPYFFQFSKNGRKDNETNKNRKYAEINNSTMNRICRAFDDLGNINMNYAGIAPFNWQMLLRESCTSTCPEIPVAFCRLDSKHLSSIIESQELNYVSEKQMVNGADMAAEEIANYFVSKYGSLETVYPYIVKHLFAGEGMNRPAHKQMFWMIFGGIALENIKFNLKSSDVCPECGMRIPGWVKEHVCAKNAPGFYQCVECGKMCERTNGRQYRCSECQEKLIHEQKKIRQAAFRQISIERKQARITRLRSSSEET